MNSLVPWIALTAGIAAVGAPPTPAPPSETPPLEAYIVEPMGWDELRCFDYDPETCAEGDPTLRVRYRVVESLRGAGWPGEHAIELAGDVSDYGVETTRQMLVLRPPDRIVAVMTIDAVVGGGWAYCGTPHGFEKKDLALVQPVDFAGVFANFGRLSKHGRRIWEDNEYTVDGDVVRCRRGVPAGVLLRWIDAGGRP
jgi:hypothetical protein